MNYHVDMKHILPTLHALRRPLAQNGAKTKRPAIRRWQIVRLLGLTWVLTVYALQPARAQVVIVPQSTVAAVQLTDSAPNSVNNSELDAELFYNILLGELSLLNNEPRAAFALILDSARKTKDEALFQRAVSIALQSRSGESALTAARAWRLAVPESIAAARYVAQILIALNRTDQTAKAVSDYLALFFASEANHTSSAVKRDEALASVADIFTRATDKAAAALVAEQALSTYLSNPATAVTAWTTLGRVRLAAGDSSGALEAARRAQALQPNAPEPALLALAMMGPKVPLAESIVKQYLGHPANQPKPEIRLVYTRTLLSNSRFADALTQALKLSTESPDFAPGWLILGSMQYQESQDNNDNKATQAQASLKKFIQLTEQLPAEQRHPGLSRAYLLLSKIAENNKDLNAAQAWLANIDSSEEAFTVQNRRASLLAKQGKLDEALLLLGELPENSADDVRLKLSAQVQLLRDHKQYQRAYDLLAKGIASLNAAVAPNGPDPSDLSDLNYDLAMLAEKLNRLDDMERLLRLVIAAKPEDSQAYNALGYSLAERRLRLPEAKTLIQKAVQLSPNDPFIADSLGWVEFRMGNVSEAQRILEAAFKTKPDAEIAAHLGEVLWSQGRKTEATAIWKAGLQLNSSQATLLETLKRLGVKP